MSHGGSEKNEPNLTPLLDMVLQLVMFFMLCANFTQEQLDETIKLPKATTAKSLDAKMTSILFINVNEQGHLLPVDGDRQPLLTPIAIESYMKRKYDLAERAEKGSGEKTTIIIRAHQDCPFEGVYRVVVSSKRAGYRLLQFRALMNN